MIDPLEERALLKKAKAGDQIARDRLALAFRAFAEREARKLAGRQRADGDEAAGETFFVILAAIEAFDLRRRERFSTFLWHRIRGQVTQQARVERREGVIDVFKRRPLPKPQSVPQWTRRMAQIGQPIATFWPSAALSWVRKLPRQNDRLIAKWLWFDFPPLRPADIARSLDVSRSAVTQRRRVLQTRLTQKFGNLYFGEGVRPKSLNEFEWFDIYEEDIES